MLSRSELFHLSDVKNQLTTLQKRLVKDTTGYPKCSKVIMGLEIVKFGEEVEKCVI